MMSAVTYRAIELPKHNSNIIKAMLSLNVVEKSIRKLLPGQLLIRIHYATCNPSDIALMQNAYGIKKDAPLVPGFEGSGVVVAVSEDLSEKDWLGKTVSCFSQDERDGTWAEYFVAYTNQVVVSERINLKQAANFFVNPFTAYGLMEIAVRQKSHAAIINAAGSQVATFLVNLLKKKQIKSIGIIRKSSLKDKLPAIGFDKVLVSTDSNFENELKQIAFEYKATIAFDAVAGEHTGILLNALPGGSKIVVYGGLSGKPATNLSAIDLIFKNKTVSGFNLNDWIKSSENMTFKKAKTLLQHLIIEEGLETPVQIEVKPDEVAKGMRQYLSAMTIGKMLISFA